MAVPKVVVVGSVNADLVARTPHLPTPGETVLGESFETVPGGKGANQAVAAARLGAAVTLVARVGDDDLGRGAVAGFAAEGVDTRHITVDSHAPTGTAVILVDSTTGENCIVVVAGANGRLRPADIEAARPAIEAANILLCQLEVPLDAVATAIRIAHAAGVRVLLNPAPACDLPPGMLARVSILTPNEAEAQALTGAADPADAAAILLSRGVGFVVVTLGERGALIAQPGSPTIVIPAAPVGTVIDTTAAGDCFSAALAVRLAGGAGIADSVRFAHAAASVSVGRAGAQPSLPHRDEVESVLQANP